MKLVFDPTKMRQVFPGRNFMTPAPIDYYVGEWRGRKVYVELSRGEGMSRQPIFGVTVRWDTGLPIRLDQGDPSNLFQSEAAARRYILNGLVEE